MAYCTPDEVLQRMGHPNSTDTGLLARVADAIPAVQKVIDGDTGRTFEPTTRTIEFGAHDRRALRVPDLVSVTTLKLDDDDDGVFEVTIDSGDYELDTLHTSQAGYPFDTVRLLERNWPIYGKRRRRIEIVGSWGWAAVPDPINQACALLAARIAQRGSHALFGTEQFGDLGAASIRSNDPDYMRLIGQYVKPLVA